KLPEKFKDMISSLAADEPRVDGLTAALEESDPSVSLRVNPGKAAPSIAVGAEPVAWCPGGFYLDRRPSFTLDPAMHQGRYYVQDASSMFLGNVVRELTGQMGPIAYLDACAAPGGKTTTAIDALPEGSLVVANEFDYRRAEILRENVTKWGYPGVVVSRGDTSRFRKLPSTFDIIAADVPCSGEGMMRKDAEAVAQWSRGLIAECVARQREIVDNLWGALKPGGYLIYSTCTFNRDEDEAIVEYLIETYDAESVTPESYGAYPEILPAIGSAVSAYRFMPHRTRGEGLFLAVLRKPGELREGQTSERSKSGKGVKGQQKLPAWWPAGLEPVVIEDTIYGVEPRWRDLTEQLLKRLDVIMPGVEVAVIKGRDLIPAQGVAMLRGDRIPADVDRVEVDEPTALTYLRRDAVTLGDDAGRGYLLLTYQGMPLGWVKNLGNRSNNLYPANWRIRHL
ncbi:MAG: rRNA cytosine-C5-methyltransferase, partial [Muribaculaceae bacterium]|nr:rRNA cytosine-C5-methyltransferase [Muribaculaceae bacterium]